MSHKKAFSSVKEASMDYEMTIYFRQKWKDSRLGLPVFHSSANQRVDKERFLKYNIDQPY